jgi:hypothetical protein
LGRNKAPGDVRRTRRPAGETVQHGRNLTGLPDAAGAKINYFSELNKTTGHTGDITIATFMPFPFETLKYCMRIANGKWDIAQIEENMLRSRAVKPKNFLC